MGRATWLQSQEWKAPQKPGQKTSQHWLQSVPTASLLPWLCCPCKKDCNLLQRSNLVLCEVRVQAAHNQGGNCWGHACPIDHPGRSHSPRFCSEDTHLSVPSSLILCDNKGSYTLDWRISVPKCTWTLFSLLFPFSPSLPSPLTSLSPKHLFSFHAVLRTHPRFTTDPYLLAPLKVEANTSRISSSKAFRAQGSLLSLLHS